MMMNADKGIYKGLPQDDWENNPKFARIISTGPTPSNQPSGNNKKKNGTRIFLAIVFFLCILAVVGIISFRIYETSPKSFFDFWGQTTGKPNDQNNASSTSSNETLANQNTALQNSSTIKETTPLTNQTALDNSSLANSESSSEVGITLLPTIVENETSANEFIPEFAELTNASSLGNGSSLFSEILREYFNASSPKEDQIRQWLEHLLSKPSLEVIMLAGGIIFAGLSLLIMGVVCAIGQRNRRRKRRHRLNRKAKEGNRIEKVILLADDASEEEFTKT